MAEAVLQLRLVVIRNDRVCSTLVSMSWKQLSTMTHPTDCKSTSLSNSDAVLPTRQKNSLRLLLAKPVITPEEVAALDYRSLERAPGVGKQSIDIIRAWLNSHGYDLSHIPTNTTNTRGVQRKRKLERAIDYLRGHGYEVRRSG